MNFRLMLPKIAAKYSFRYRCSGIFLGVLLLCFVACRAQQVDQGLAAQLKQQLADKNYAKIDGILVQQGNHLLVEEYFIGFDRDKGHDTRSAFKSVTSLLAGIAIDQGLMKLDDPISRFFPELKEERKRNIRLRDLLEMRSGLGCEEVYEIGPECESEMFKTQDWVAFCLNVPMVRSAGLNWSYNSNEPMLVGELIARASGMNVMAFADKYLFSPLEITGFKWTVSPKGQGMTAGSFEMRPVDMLKIIDMVAAGGKWKGRQIVSEPWIKSSTDCQIPTDFSFVRYSRLAEAKYESSRYGFFWYQERLRFGDIDTEVLFASGNGGQYMMYLPQYDLKVVFTGSSYGNWRGKLPFELLLKYIIPAVRTKG